MNAHEAVVKYVTGAWTDPATAVGSCTPCPSPDGRGPFEIRARTADPSTGRTLQIEDLPHLFEKILDLAASLGIRSLLLELAGSSGEGISPKASAYALGLALQSHALQSDLPSWVTVCVSDVGQVLPGLHGAARLIEGRSFQSNVVMQLAKARAEGIGPELLSHLERMRSNDWAADPWHWIILFRFLLEQWALDLGQVRTELPTELGARLQKCLEAEREQQEPSLVTLARHCRIAVDEAHAFMARGQVGNALQDQKLTERLGSVATAVARWLLERQGTSAAAEPATGKRPSPNRTDPKGQGVSRRVALPDTLPVRRLHDFLTTQLSVDARRDLHERLTEAGYQGDEHQCLLEYCVKEADLEQLLNEHFSQRQLREAIADNLGLAVDPRVTLHQLVRTLLEALGFPTARVPRGLRSAFELTERLSFQRLTSDSTTLRGLALELAIDIEALLHQYLHAMVQFTTGMPADLGLRRLGLLTEDGRLERCTLGKLLELLVRLPAALEALKDEQTSVAWISLGLDRLIPECASIVVRQRNAMSHPALTRETTQAPLSADDIGRFVEAARELLTHFARLQPRAFPRSILVQEVRIDRWGRRTTIGVDDAGRTEWIFSEAWLCPGETYLMLAANNPLRVDPILIPWGCGERPKSFKEPRA